MLAVPDSSKKYVLSAEPFQNNRIRLTGMLLELGANDALPVLDSTSSPAGPITMSLPQQSFSLPFPTQAITRANS